MILKNSIVKMLHDRYGIDLDVAELLFNEGLLSEKNCRDLLIKIEYQKRVEPKGKVETKNVLADKYCVSISCIEKIIYTP